VEAIGFIKFRGSATRGVNIQNDKGRAKAYQVKQVLKAIERMEIEHGTEKRKK
jgi:hypothetical protein